MYCGLARKLYDEMQSTGELSGVTFHAEGIFRAYEGISHLYQAEEAEKGKNPSEEHEGLAKAIDCLEKSKEAFHFSEYRDQWNERIICLRLEKLYRSQNRLKEAHFAYQRVLDIERTCMLFGDLPVMDEIAAGKEKPASDDIIGHMRRTAEFEFEFKGQALEAKLLRGSQLKFLPEYDYAAMRVSGDSMDQAGIAPNDYVILRKPKDVSLEPSPGDIVAAMFRNEDDKATLKRFYFDRLSDSVTLKPESSNSEHKTRVLRPEAFVGNSPSVEIVGIAIAVLEPQPHTKVQQRRFTAVRFPEQCKIYQPVRLSIQLTMRPMHDVLPPSEVIVDPTTRETKERWVEPRTLSKSGLSDNRSPIKTSEASPGSRNRSLSTDLAGSAVVLHPELTTLTGPGPGLLVFVSADGFKIDREWEKLSVPVGQDSEKIEFELVGQKLGAQIVEIGFFHGPMRVGYIVVQTRVVDSATSGQDRQVIREGPDERALPSPQQGPDVAICVEWEKGEGIRYSIIERLKWWQRQPAGFMPLALDEKEVDALLRELGDQMKVTQLDRLSENDLKTIWRRFSHVGLYVYETFLSDELRRHSSTWPAGSIVAIDTDEHWIPWELIYDDDDFWGNKFILARSPRIPDPSAFSDSDKIMERYTSKELRKIANVIGGLSPSQIMERVRELFSAFGTDILIEDIEEATLETFFQSIADADIIHLTCHGSIAPPSWRLANGPDWRHCLTPIDLEGLPKLVGRIIFANVCASAVSSFFLGQLHNFAWPCYKKGAVAYIGTLGLVPTKYAVAFAERFYESLLKDHTTIGESLHYAKSKTKRENPFWLFYTLYGDPFAKKYVQS
jgi:hypothetical protein